MSRASGTGGLNYSATLNIEELKKKSEEALKLFKRLQEESAKVIKVNLSSQAPNTKALTAFQEARIAATKTLLNAQVASEKLRQENLLLDADLKAGRITAQQAAAATKANTIARQELARSTKEGRLALVAANGSYDEANRKLIALGRSIKAAEGGFNSTNPAIRAQIQEYNILNRSLKDFDSSLGNHQRNVGNYGGALNGVIGSLSGMAAGFLSATAILQSAFDTALKTDAIRTSLEFTFNSSDIAQTKMEGLEKTARRLGLEYTSLADSYRAFAGAAVASNFSLKETDKIFNSVANAGAKLKLTSDQVSGALKALEQMISKGNVQSEELKGQLGERLPGAFAIAARAMGVTTVELNKMLKDGKVMADDLLPKLADELDRTFSNDKTEQVKSLQGEVNNLKNSFTQIIETKGALSALFTFIVGAAGKVTEGIAKVSQAIGIYYSILTDGKKFVGDSLKGVRNEALEELKAGADARAKDIPKETDGKSGLYNRLNQEKLALRDLTKEYESAKSAYEKTRSGDRNFADAKTMHTLEEEQQYQMYLVKSLRTEYEKLYGDKGLPKLVEDSALKSVKAIQTRINELKKLDGSATEGSNIYKRIDALQGRLKKPSAVNNDPEINAQRTLQSEIDAMTKKGVNMQLTADQQELADVDAKYKKLIDKAIAYNNNKENIKKGLKVNTSGLAVAQTTEKAEITFKKEAADLKISLDEQGDLYAAFEDLKTKVGEDKARERYANKLDTDKTYLESLQKQEEDMLNPGKAKGGTPEDEVRNKAALKVLQERIAATELIEQKSRDDRYANAYQSAKTTAQALLEVEKEYHTNVKALGDRATQEQLDNLGKIRDKSASKVAVDKLTGSDAFTKLFGDLDTLAASEIQTLINEIERQFNALGAVFDPIDLAAIRKKLTEAKAMIIKDNPFAQVGSAIKAIFEDGADGAVKAASQIKLEWNNLAASTSASFQFVDDAVQSCDILKDALGEIGTTALSSLAQIAQSGIAVATAVKLAGVASAAVAAGTAAAISTAEKASVILAIISAALQVVQAIAGFFKSIFNAHDKRIEKSIKGHQEQVESLGRAYNRLERDVTEAVGKGVEQAHLNQIENLKQQQAELAKIREAEKDKKKPDQNKINEVNDQIASIGDQIKDTQNAMIQALTGTTSKSIADGIIAGFKSGKRAAKDFADDFNGLMEDALLQALKTNFLDQEIANFYQRFAEASKDGLDANEVSRLRTEYTGIIQGGLEMVKDIDKITGGPKKEDKPKEGVSGGIVGEALKEDTANRMLGLQQGQYDINKQMGLTMGDMLQIGRSKLAALEKIAVNTLRSANNTDRLENIETALTSIDKKTTGSSSGSSLDQALRDNGIKI